MSQPEPRTLIVSVDRAGHVNQCLAFCDRIGWSHREPVVRIPAPGRMSSRWERFFLRLRRRAATAAAAPRSREPGLLRIVASGAAAEAVAAAYRKLWGADLFAVFIGATHAREPIFDASVVAYHALGRGETPETIAIPAGGELVWMRGVYVARIDGAPDAERSGVVAVIGGVNKAFTIDADRIAAQLAEMMRTAAAETLTIVFSRRTPSAVERRLKAAFPGARIVDRADRAGYLDALRTARRYAVTPDSISMVCELCATGRPVATFDLACFDDEVSTARFHRDAARHGLVTPIGAPASELRPDVSFDVSDRVAEIYDRWLAGR